MGKEVSLLLAIHNHQPVGNFPGVLERSYQKAYLPFLQVFRDHPPLRLTLHYSGWLLEWLARNHPEFLALIRELIEQGRVEIMSGGFYEPILTTLYESDKIGQIRKLSAFIREELNTRPRGIWLAERVWEPHLTETLYNAGAEYIVIDDHHFIMAGLRGPSLFGYYLTEEKGKILRVFPGSERLRYLIPFRPVEETLSYLRGVAESGEDPLAIMGDDGEKFGVWPETHHSVYEEGWLHRFFQALQENGEWIRTRLFSEVIDALPPRGRIYLPTSSYMEMGEWSLIYDASEEFRLLKQRLQEAGLEELSRPFLCGGFWRNFFSKYPESNLMHKKMLAISETVHHLPEGEARAAALEELWQGQCNDAYWHGVFGGLYLPHLRSSIHEHLIRAQAIAERELHAGRNRWIHVRREDLDKDGNREVILGTESYTLLLSPHCGGGLMACDFIPRCFNLQDTLTRVPEFYHREIRDLPATAPGTGEAVSIHERIQTKEAGLAGEIIYDPFPRHSLLDHFLEDHVSLPSLRSCNYRERGDFARGRYGAELVAHKETANVVLERKGWVASLDPQAPPQEVTVRKVLEARAGDSAFSVLYTIGNRSDRVLTGRFGVEWNLNLLAGNAPDRYYRINGRPPEAASLDSMGETPDTGSVELVDEWKGIAARISADPGCRLGRFPVESVSLSEGGAEKIYQASCLFLLWDLSLQPGARWDIKMEMKMLRIADHRERDAALQAAQPAQEERP